MLLPRTPDKNSILFYLKTGIQKNHSPSSFGYMEEVGKAEIKKQDIFQIESLHSSKRGGTPGATIGYRLSGEANWPAQIYDCKAAIRWLRANAGKFCYDPTRIALWGSSAGGQLVSMLGTTGRNKELEGTLGNHLDQSSHVQAVVNYYGPSALLQMNDHPSKIDHNAPGSPESQLIGAPIQQSKKKARQASPLHHVTADDASIIHFHGTDDSLVPVHQSTLFHRALKDKGVPSTLITLQGGGHSMPSTFTQSKVIPFLDFILYQKGDAPVGSNNTI